MKISKNKKLGIIAASSVLLIAGTIAITSEINPLSSMLNGATHSNKCHWVHYDRIEPTFNTEGVKEYWICCEHNEIQFEVPTSGNITDGTHPAGFKDSIMPVDERARLTPYYQRILDFDREDGCEYPFYDLSKSHKVSSVEILDGIGVNGTRGIKAQFTAGTDSGLFFKKEYLDAVFANDTIQAIEFDAKGDAHAPNFRHRQASGNNICYHFNHSASMFGLTTNWTTYSFTRDMYNELKTATNYDGGFVIWGSLTGTGALYLDNIRPTKRNLANDSLSVSFDDMNSDILGLGTNDVFLLSPYTYNSSNRAEKDGIIKINSENAGVESIDFSTSIKSEGSRSLHIHKKANSSLYFYVKNSILDACNPYGLTFDIYITQYLNPGQLHFYRNDRSSNPENPPYVLKGTGWQTFTVPYCNTRDVTTNPFDGLFGLSGTDGKKEMDIYIDNIRPATPNDLYESFEDKGVFKFDTYYEIGGNYKINDTINPINFPRNETWAQNLRDNDFASFWVNDPSGGLSNISVDTKHVKDGVSALKFEVKNANSPIYMFFNKVENSKMNIDDEISFDVYSECNGNISFGKANTAGRQEAVKTVSPNTWTNVTFKKGDLINGVDQFFRLNEASIGATGSFWIDNIVIKKQEVFKKPLDFERGTATNTSGAFEYSVDGIKLMYNVATSNFASAELTTNLPFGRKGQALKLTKNDNYVAFYLGLDFCNNIPNGGTISFDLYSTVGVNSKTSVRNLLDGNNNLIGGGDYQHPANQWTTYTFSKSNLGSDGRFLIIQGSTAGDFYFDNFRINKNVEDLHENSGTFYLSPDEQLTIDFGTMNQGLKELYLDNELLGTSKYSISNGKATFELDAISNGEHKLSFKALTGDYCYNNIEHYFGIYRASTSSSLNASLTYGSSAYQTLSGYGDVNKVVSNGKSIAFERSGSNILVPDAALIECLPTTNNQKSSGNVKLFVISGDKNSSVKELNVAISMTSANVKAGYTESTNKTFGTFGYSSTSGGSNNNVLNDIDHMMEYQRSGLESVYEQLYAIPVNLADNYFTEPQVSNWITRDFNNCEELGMSFLVQDEFVIKMCKETSSIYNRDINVGTDTNPITVRFANSSELDTYVLNRLTKYAMLPALRKIVLCDEPRYNNLQQVGELYNSVRRGLDALNRQDVVINVNLLPISAGVGEDDGLGPQQGSWIDGTMERRVLTYKNYLNIFYSYANSPELTYDIYPLTSGGVNQFSYLNLEIAAQYARDNNKKLTVVTESFTNPTYDSNKNNRIMSRDDIHYLNNMLMGFGVEEISYFTYYSRDNSNEFLDDGSGSFVRELFDNNDNLIGTERMGLWYNMQTMLEEMKEFDSIILNFDFVSSNLYKTTLSSNQLKQDDAYENGNNYDDTDNLKNFGDISNMSFTKDYWMLTNLKDGNSKNMHMIQNVVDPKYSSCQTATITFKSGFSYAVVYENGTQRIVNLSSNVLTLQLSSGNAAFVLVY